MSQEQKIASGAEYVHQDAIEQQAPQVLDAPLDPSPPTSPLQQDHGTPLKPSTSPSFHPKPAPSFMHAVPAPAPVNIRCVRRGISSSIFCSHFDFLLKLAQSLIILLLPGLAFCTFYVALAMLPSK
jgi:hypothetical protein